MPSTRFDDPDEAAIALRSTTFSIKQWLASNWLSLLIVVGMVLNWGGWIKLQERSDTEQLRDIGLVQDQLDHHMQTDDRIFVRKDVLAPELDKLAASIVHLNTLLELERKEREAAASRR